jgi:hypothetical protein
MRKHKIELTERELRDVLNAFDFAGEKHDLWFKSKRIVKLYEKLRGHGL